MRPKSGVRFELRLVREDPAEPLYQVDLALPDAGFEGTAAIAKDSGEVAFAWRDAPPDWCAQAVRAQLRTLYRDRAAGYPRRVTRWRPQPERGPAE
jgi:hypothetical protein